VNKEMKQLFEKLEAQGWKIELRKGGHYMATPPDPTKPIVVMSHTPSDHRDWANTISRLRRSGANL
jgi:predicted RNA binding protein YcfA (HicA-like mRNA interferase family)